jgi:CheY-like chemotaxis protein
MHGRVEVESTVGLGSQFRVTLPLKPGNKPTEQGMRHFDDILPRRILVVDDSPQNIELLLNILAKGGHQVSTAENGQSAVDLYRAQPFDLVLMDLQMPVMDGLQAAREIRRIERERRSALVPIIGLTASVGSERRQLALDAGMGSFVMKPLDIAMFKAELILVTGCKVTPMGLVAAGGPTAGAPCHRVEAADWPGGIARWGGEEPLSRASGPSSTRPRPVLLRSSRNRCRIPSASSGSCIASKVRPATCRCRASPPRPRQPRQPPRR